MTLSNFEKAKKDREAQKVLLSFLQTSTAGHAVVPLDASEVDTILTKVQQVWADLVEIHRQIITYLPAGTDIGPLETDHLTLLGSAMKLETDLGRIKATFKRSVSSSSSSGGAPGSVPPWMPKLPDLKIKQFSGIQDEWVSFKNRFTTSIHDSSMPDVNKLSYLNELVTGEALDLIKSMAITPANYKIAWDLLNDRYENERELKFSLFNTLMLQPSVHSESAEALRSLVNVSKGCVRSLEALKSPTQHWDEFLVYVVAQKLDTLSRQQWELSLKSKKIPPFQELIEFLEHRSSALAASELSRPHLEAVGGASKSVKKVHAHHTDVILGCKFCPASHLPFKCPRLIAMSVAERKDLIKKAALCLICFRVGHFAKKCSSKWSCQKCSGRHNVFLHEEKSAETGKSGNNSVQANHCKHTDERQTILATAVAEVVDSRGESQFVRAFLDPGSTASFITEACIRRLGLQRTPSDVEVTGLGSASVGRAKGITTFQISPHFHCKQNYKHNVSAYVFPKVTGWMPQFKYDPVRWSHIEDLQLADPNFYKPGEVDVLLGGDIFWELLLDGKILGPSGTPTAVKSTLGWLIVGPAKSSRSEVKTFTIQTTLDDQIQRFWELESVPNRPVLSQEEEACEKHFQLTHSRVESGRFMVKLPFRPDAPSLGRSREIAVRRLKQLERRLESKPEVKDKYHEFMRQYLELGHMTKVQNPVPLDPNVSCYIPHHFVFKDPAKPNKFRVVFDASAKTESGISLNQTLMVGPTIQRSIVGQLMNFMKHKVAFVGDIEKMFRQILLHPECRDHHRILWRETPEIEPEEYQLTTVTYGTASAPFQANRVLQQLADDEALNFPLAAKVAREDFYVDDMMSGCANLEKAMMTQFELLELMKKAGLKLMKWASNYPELLENLPEDMRADQSTLPMETDSLVKTLGLHWNTSTDEFMFKVTLPPVSPVLTKRSFLSEIAQTFDPLGWLAPAIVKAKIMFQELWKLQIDWDDPLPPSVKASWKTFRDNLHQIEGVRIKRCFNPHLSTDLQLHGFSDASEKAYAGVVYIRANDLEHGPIITLITAKTKVAPVKTQSLPRLELCGALLLADLMDSVQTSLGIQFSVVKAWTDSTTVLDWIRSSPTKLHRKDETFVRNRVTKIQDYVTGECWGHVPGVENPADCASRGLDPSELVSHPLWWHGPWWLSDSDPVPVPRMRTIINEDVHVEEEKTLLVAHVTIEPDPIFQRYEQLTKLKRVTAWCFRFYNKCKAKTKKVDCSGDKTLTADEMDRALLSLVKSVQMTYFKSEFDSILQSKPISKKSRLLRLNPFLDSAELLRVGGRISKAQIPDDRKCPFILPAGHPLTQQIIAHEHRMSLHAGPQLLWNILQSRFWIIGGRDAVRRYVRKCVICTRQSARMHKQIMADLPEARVTPTRPFLRSGVDYAGPFTLKQIVPRSKATFKAYICLFVCFSTRAIHLELATSLSTGAFMMAYRRFISRRGKRSDVFSDCGTNFVGAAAEMKELFDLVLSDSHNDAMTNQLAAEGTQWHFNSPGAPHFGGLWEAGVKSVKFHLRRVIGDTVLNYEEFSTLLTQIESCLNSRPLTQMSTDPSDLTALTPGHFLVGGILQSLPDADLTTEKMNRLTRFQLIQQLRQHFWNRWSTEFLSRLQQRPKWMDVKKDVSIGDLVVVKDDRFGPSKWPLARIIAVHPGADGHVRTVTLKTQDGEKDRPIVKICLLPVETTKGKADDVL